MKKLQILMIVLLISLSIFAFANMQVKAQTVNLSQFVFSEVSSPQTAGKAFSITITAKASNGNTVTSYTGTNTLTVSLGTISPTSTTAFVAGVWAGQVTLSQAGTGFSISTSGGGKSGKSNTFTVNPGALDRFVFNTISSPQTASKTFSTTITAKDANSNTVTSYTGTNTLTVSAGTISPTGTSAFVAGIWTGSVSISASGSGITIGTSGSSKSGTSNSFTVNSGALDHFVFSNIGTQTAGTAFTITITAKDSNGNTVTSYTGTNTLSVPLGTISPTSTGTFSSGTWTGSVSISASGSGITIGTSGSSKSGTSNSFTVNAVILDHFVFNAISSPQTAGSVFSITITAKTPNGNTVTSYTGTPILSVSTGTISSPITGAFSSGVWTGAITATGVGSSVTITVTDGTHTGTSNSFTVNPTISASAGANGTISPSGSVSVNYGSSQSFNIRASTGYQITDVIADNVSLGAISSYTFTAVLAAHTITANFAINTFNITASAGDGGSISPNGSVNVNYGNNQSFTVTENTGYYIFDVLVNGSSVGAVSSYTFSNVQAAYTILATFAPTPTPSPSPTGTPSPAPTPTPKPTPTPTPIPLPTLSPTVTPLTTTVPASIASGATVNIAITGNITSSQISNATITSYQPTTTTTISFTITGPSGTVGFGNMTIPKNAVSYGKSPVVYINGQQALNQGYTQDSNNFYVWYTTHFSTHQVKIQFAGSSPTPSGLLGPVLAVGITVPEIILIFSVIAVRRLRRKPENA
jgi:hypothetical protein